MEVANKFSVFRVEHAQEWNRACFRAWDGFILPWARRCGDFILLSISLGSHWRCGGHPGGYGCMGDEWTRKGLLADAVTVGGKRPRPV